MVVDAKEVGWFIPFPMLCYCQIDRRPSRVHSLALVLSHADNPT